MSDKDEFEVVNEKIRARMDKIGRKIMIMSGKGGVGKTTVTVNLANELSAMGCRVGVLDTDLHGPNVAKMFGIEGASLMSNDGVTFLPVEVNENLKVISLSFALEDQDAPVIWRGSMKMGAIRQFLSDVEWGELDYLLIDTPPGTGDEQLTVCQAIPELTGTIIVTTPQELVSVVVEKAVNMARMMNIPIIGLVENMSYLTCPDCGKKISLFGESRLEEHAARYGIEKTARLPLDSDIASLCDKGLIELFEGDFLDEMSDAVENFKK